VAFSRWDPLQDLLTLHERINRLSGMDAPGWMPAVDLYETADRIVITAELPGLSREDVQIHIQEGKLFLRGHRPAGTATCEQYHQVERGHGQFSRTFALPQAVDVDAIDADLENGILTISIPKKNRSEHRIEVQ
jgi:HSP20 family protein